MLAADIPAVNIQAVADTLAEVADILLVAADKPAEFVDTLLGAAELVVGKQVVALLAAELDPLLSKRDILANKRLVFVPGLAVEPKLVV